MGSSPFVGGKRMRERSPFGWRQRVTRVFGGIEAAATNAEFADCFAGRQALKSKTCHDVTDKGCCMPTAQLLVVFSSRNDIPNKARAHPLPSLRYAPLGKGCAVQL